MIKATATQNYSLSIVIPVYNEEKRIEKTLLELFRYQKINKLKAEIVVVDDGSTDGTMSVLKKYIKRIKIIPVSPNRGKGFAIKIGMIAASGEKVLFMDADLATPLTEIEKIIEKSKFYDIVIGSRKLKESKVQRNVLRNILGKAFGFISHLLVPLDCKDSQCGFKIFTKSAALNIFNRSRINRWAFDIEVLYLASLLNYRVLEMPVSWREVAGSKVKIFKDAFLMLRDLLKIRFFVLKGAYNINEFKKENYVE